jgi:hypothetical protein
MSKDARLDAAIRLDKINRQEEEKRKIAEAKNSLESYIYVTKEKVSKFDFVFYLYVTNEVNLVGNWNQLKFLVYCFYDSWTL